MREFHDTIYNDAPLPTSCGPENADRRPRTALIQWRAYGGCDLTICEENGGFQDLDFASFGYALQRAAAWIAVGARLAINDRGRL